MGKIITQFTMSLDGFIADAQDDVGRLLRWYFQGDTDFPVPGSGMNFKLSTASAALLQQEWGAFGAIVTGRRDFDVSKAWGGKPPLDVPTFIITHQPPPEWTYPGSPFTFVTAGVAQAITLAQAAAGERDIALSGTQIVQQAFRAGLVDAIYIDLAPILLGSGIRLFDHLGEAAIDLEISKVVPGRGVTHLRYTVLK
ncbi:MAG: dihydrofolate reductase family protein [Caldilineaceae bacterium]|nr:dihydrofolate reductase family protein [Caldilineaceae bacterium]